MGFVEMAYQNSNNGEKDQLDPSAFCPSSADSETASPNLEAELNAIKRNSGCFSRLLERIITANASEKSRIIQFMGVDGQKSASALARQFALYASSHFPAPVCLIGAGSGEIGIGHVYTQGQIGSGSVAVQPAESNEEGLYKVPNAELYVSSGGFGPYSANLGTLPMRFDVIKKRLVSRFPLLIVDTQLNSNAIEGVLISSKVDGVILVLEAERSRRDLAKDTYRRIENAGGRVVGAVLTEKKQYIPSFLRRCFE